MRILDQFYYTMQVYYCVDHVTMQVHYIDHVTIFYVISVIHTPVHEHSCMGIHGQQYPCMNYVDLVTMQVFCAYQVTHLHGYM